MCPTTPSKNYGLLFKVAFPKLVSPHLLALLYTLRAPYQVLVASPGIEAHAIYALPTAVCDVVDPHRLIVVHSAHSKTPAQVFARSWGRGSRPWHQINTIARRYEQRRSCAQYHDTQETS